MCARQGERLLVGGAALLVIFTALLLGALFAAAELGKDAEVWPARGGAVLLKSELERLHAATSHRGEPADLSRI